MAGGVGGVSNPDSWNFSTRDIESAVSTIVQLADAIQHIRASRISLKSA